MYGFTSLCFLLFGFSLVLIIRWQHAYSGQPLPLVGGLLGESAPGGVVPPELFNQLGAMHGTIMVFLGVVPLAVGAFGNYVLPLPIGAPDMAFPLEPCQLLVLSRWRPRHAPAGRSSRRRKHDALVKISGRQDS
jgi:heme/copper-type cytochrome/quinol oxidase subunit 1